MEETYIDSLDPEKLLQCPYDKNHQIRACRFPYHLIKCKKNHPDVANKLATCPFNARHQVPRTEISHHISSCDDKSCIEQDVVNQTRNPGQETLAESTWQCPPCDEDWDKDLWEQTSTPFVWGTANYCGKNSPASNLVMEHKSNLASGMRVPKSLPYVLPWKNMARGFPFKKFPFGDLPKKNEITKSYAKRLDRWKCTVTEYLIKDA